MNKLLFDFVVPSTYCSQDVTRVTSKWQVMLLNNGKSCNYLTEEYIFMEVYPIISCFLQSADY